MDIALEIYNTVVSVIGTLPIELEFIYGMCTLIIFVFLIMIAAFPFVLIYKVVN